MAAGKPSSMIFSQKTAQAKKRNYLPHKEVKKSTHMNSKQEISPSR